MTTNMAHAAPTDLDFSFRDFDYEFKKAMIILDCNPFSTAMATIGEAKTTSQLLASGGCGEEDNLEVIIPLTLRAAKHHLTNAQLVKARNLFMDIIPDRSGSDERTDMPKRASMAGLIILALVGNTDEFRDALPLAMTQLKSEVEASFQQESADWMKTELKMTRLNRNGYFDFQSGIRKFFEQSAQHHSHHVERLAEGGLKILDAMEQGKPIPSPTVQRFMDIFKPL